MYKAKHLALTTGALVVLSLVAAPGAHAGIIITSDVYNGHTYYLLDAATWNDSEAAALALGGHLAKIDDQNENNFVAQRFGPGILDFTHRGGLWIGLTDQAQEGTFVWADGTPLSVGYTNWFDPSEPSDCLPLPGGGCLSEDFVHMTWWEPGGWNDVPFVNGDGNTILMNGIVEVDGVVPEASSLVLLSMGMAGLIGRVRQWR